eukprot:TRINITY_DN680_c0_g4_i1.p1 TRINITY_DN680_c0_g4~~TRINITY_DN680_c0_g4_i1.p1  ORF type:complete len:254 (+),score=90.28 TRINITY_DN680_c0_g4_i1:73-834(+)
MPVAVTSAPQFRIATHKDVDSIVDFLLNHFITTEPLTVALGVSPDFPPLREQLTNVATEGVAMPTSFVAESDGKLLGVILYKTVSMRDYIDPSTEASPDSDSLAGDVCDQQHALNMLTKVLVDIEHGLPQLLLENPQTQKLIRSEEELRVGNIAVGMIMCVKKDDITRRQGIGMKLLNTALKRQVEMGVKITVGTCTAKASQGLVGSKTTGYPLRTLNYSELTHPDGTPVTCPDGTDRAVLMALHLTPAKAQL